MFEIKNKNDPRAYVYRSETATNLLDAVAEAHTLGYSLDGADLSGLTREGRACPHGVSRLAPCDECTAAQAHTTSASAPLVSTFRGMTFPFRVKTVTGGTTTIKEPVDVVGNPYVLRDARGETYTSEGKVYEGTTTTPGDLDLSTMTPVPEQPKPACAHAVPYPDPCLDCANEHLYAAADAPPKTQEARDRAMEATFRRLHALPPKPPATAEATQVGGTTAILEERGARYGKFTDHARITQEIKSLMFGALPKGRILAHDQREALEMIAHKIGRIINGDPNYEDSWRDIAGYAQLVADRLKGVSR